MSGDKKIFEITKLYYLELTKIGITLERLQQSHYGDEFTWRINDKIDETMHLIMKPLIQNILDTALIKSNSKIIVNNPVIHFRCADTPFVKNQDYTFQKHCFFKEALNYGEKALQKKFKEIIILSFTNHNSNNENNVACSNYVNYLKEYLEKLQYNITIQSNSSLDDFALIFYSPISISTSSSFSFMAGFFGKGQYISTTNGDRCIDCSDWVLKGYNLNHDLVNDYYDRESVLQQLQNC
jgi:hypothetical protein